MGRIVEQGLNVIIHGKTQTLCQMLPCGHQCDVADVNAFLF